jgi:hypothetical protein
MSIFTKNCPVCSASQPSETERCSCGHRFDASASDGEMEDLKSIYHEERLYRDYLAARVDEAAKGPDRQALAAARAELEAQEQRVLAMKKRLKIVRSNRHPEGVAPAPAKPAQPKPTVVTPPVQSSQPAVRTKPTSPPISVTPKSPPPTQPSIPTTATPRANEGTPRPVRAAEAPVARTPPAPVVAKPTPKPKPAAAKPPAQPSSSAQPVASNVPDIPVSSFPNGEVNKAAIQECPNCMAKVPPGAARCACGFEMPTRADEMPSLPMSEEDRAALLAALGPTRK